MHAFMNIYTDPIYKNHNQTKIYSEFPATSITNGIVILTNLFLQCTIFSMIDFQKALLGNLSISVQQTNCSSSLTLVAVGEVFCIVI